MKSIPGQSEPRVSSKEGEKQHGKQESDGDFKLRIRRARTVDTNGPEVKLTQEGEENKSTSEKHKSHTLISWIFFLTCSVGLGLKERRRRRREKETLWLLRQHEKYTVITE